MLAQIKAWAMDPNIRNFVVSLVAIGMVYYIYRGENHYEKLRRVLVGAVVLVFTAFVIVFLYSFSK